MENNIRDSAYNALLGVFNQNTLVDLDLTSPFESITKAEKLEYLEKSQYGYSVYIFTISLFDGKRKIGSYQYIVDKNLIFIDEFFIVY